MEFDQRQYTQPKNFSGERPWQEVPWLQQEKPSWFAFPSPFQQAKKSHSLSSWVPSVARPKSSQPSRAVRNNEFPAKVQRRLLPKTESFWRYYHYHWLDKEIFFSMNKLSIAGMVAGLMFLGALFFISGFLLAFSLYGVSVPKTIMNPLNAELTGHRPSSNAFVPTHKPSALRSAATVPSQYARVGGVAVVQAPHLPSQGVVPQPMAPVPSPPPSPQQDYALGYSGNYGKGSYAATPAAPTNAGAYPVYQPPSPVPYAPPGPYAPR